MNGDLKSIEGQTRDQLFGENRAPNMSRKVRRKFDEASNSIKRKLVQMKEDFGVSSFSYLGVSSGEFAGGFMGDPAVVIEALYTAGTRNRSVAELIKMAAKGIEVYEEKRDQHKAEIDFIERTDNIAAAFDEGILERGLFEILSKEGINTLSQASAMTRAQLKQIKGVGVKRLDDLEVLLRKRNLKLKPKAIEDLENVEKEVDRLEKSTGMKVES